MERAVLYFIIWANMDEHRLRSSKLSSCRFSYLGACNRL